MQAYDKDNQPVGDTEPLDVEKLKEKLADPKVDHVRVFRLNIGDILNMNGHKFEVVKSLGRGRFMIKERA